MIFPLVDDLGCGDPGCFRRDHRASTKKFDTPALDRMAAEEPKLTHLPPDNASGITLTHGATIASTLPVTGSVAPPRLFAPGRGTQD